MYNAQSFDTTVIQLSVYNYFEFLCVLQLFFCTDRKSTSKARKLLFDFSKLIAHSAILTFIGRTVKTVSPPASPSPSIRFETIFQLFFFRDWSSVKISQQQYWEMNYWKFSEQASPAARRIVLILNRRGWASVRFSGSDKRIRIITARKRFSLCPWL